MREVVLVRGRQLAGPVSQQEAPGSGALECIERFVEREMAAGLAVEIASEQSRLADEEIGVPSGLDELVARRRVARVRENAARVLDPEGVRLERVVGNADGAFAARLAEGGSPLDAVRAGVAAGSLATTVAGAQRSMPMRAEVDRIAAMLAPA